GANVMSGIVLLSILAGLNGAILSGGRIPYAAAEDGLFPGIFARVHPSFRTPATALAIQGALACGLIAVFTAIGIAQFDYITDLVIFAEWAFYGMCTAGVIVLRRRRPDLPRPYRAWGYPYTQIAFDAVAAYLFINSLREAPKPSLVGL